MRLGYIQLTKHHGRHWTFVFSVLLNIAIVILLVLCYYVKMISYYHFVISYHIKFYYYMIYDMILNTYYIINIRINYHKCHILKNIQRWNCFCWLASKLWLSRPKERTQQVQYLWIPCECLLSTDSVEKKHLEWTVTLALPHPTNYSKPMWIYIEIYTPLHQIYLLLKGARQWEKNNAAKILKTQHPKIKIQMTCQYYSALLSAFTFWLSHSGFFCSSSSRSLLVAWLPQRLRWSHIHLLHRGQM